MLQAPAKEVLRKDYRNQLLYSIRERRRPPKDEQRAILLNIEIGTSLFYATQNHTLKAVTEDLNCHLLEAGEEELPYREASLLRGVASPLMCPFGDVA